MTIKDPLSELTDDQRAEISRPLKIRKRHKPKDGETLDCFDIKNPLADVKVPKFTKSRIK